jgi:hypothetical protein
MCCQPGFQDTGDTIFWGGDDDDDGDDGDNDDGDDDVVVVVDDVVDDVDVDIAYETKVSFLSLFNSRI